MASMRKHASLWRFGSLAVCSACVVLIAAGQPEVESKPSIVVEQASPPAAELIRVPLPITGEADTRIKAMVEQLLLKWNATSDRPILIFEFRGDKDQDAADSQFERSLSLARLLAGERLSRVRTIAYLAGSVEGHAVLPALACEEIIAAPDAVFGNAGVNEPFVDATIRNGYEEIAKRRRTVPVPIVLGMLDERLAVYRVQTLDGERYALQEELEQLRQTASVQSEEQIIPPGELGRFSGNELRVAFGIASHLARDLRELNLVLRLPDGAIQLDPTLADDRRMLKIDLRGPISVERVNWVERSVRSEIEQSRVNFLCLLIDSPGGAPTESVRLANFLAGLDPAKVRTIAFVEAEARGDAGLIAAACDQLVMSKDAVLGGPGAVRLTDRNLQDLRQPVRELAKAKQRSWSLMMALVDVSLEVHRYDHRNSGESRYFCDEERAEIADDESWVKGPLLSTSAGLNGREAIETGMARHVVQDFSELKQLYLLPDGMKGIRPNWAHQAVSMLAKPQVAGALLFIGWFALMIEFASPGLSIAGFTAGVCFLLFFWANHLNGTAGLLEVLLFLAGVLCVVLEIFVIPGMGAFGIGGGLLIMTSIVLASQTFVFPVNRYEAEQLPTSLLMALAAAMGVFSALFFMRRILTQAPVFRRVSLEPANSQDLERRSFQESMVHWEYLVGKRGTATTQLRPSGKVRFGDEIVSVISDGGIIEQGTDVMVAQVNGNEVLVRPIDRRV